VSSTRPLALITGASSGIGRAFAERLAAEGYDLIVVGRRTSRLEALAASVRPVDVTVVTADLGTNEGIDVASELCEREPISLLINNAGLAHYMPLADLPAGKARELIGVKVMAPALLTRAVLPGMLRRGAGTILNVAGMLAFSGSAPAAPPAGQRALYTGALAAAVATTQTLQAELVGTGVSVHVLCPGIVATEFHEVQGMDLSSLPRMSATDVVTAALAGIDLGEVVIAPGVEDTGVLDAVFDANITAFTAQSAHLASRYLAATRATEQTPS